MTGAAILRDGLSVGRRMSFIVAAETAGEILMTKIVLVCAPCDPKIGKNVVVINGENGVGRGLDVFGTGLICRQLLLAVVIPDRRRDFMSCLFAACILDFQRPQGL